MASRPYDPFGLWAGPWFFMDLGLKFMRTWQEACYSRLKLDVTMKPFAPVLPRVPFASAGGERTRLESEIAARQGRELPRLGCLTGVQVVGGPEAVAEEKAVEKRAVAKKPADKPVAAIAAKAPAKPKTVAERQAPKATDDEVVGVPAASSVTSMLAMQARSLSKAVAKAPKAEPAKPAVVKKAAAKPAAKKAAGKPVVKPAAKAGAKPAVKAAANKGGSKKA